jgi:uncharacterized protein (DUF1330 family)
MPAYWISRCVINDPVSYKNYTDQGPEVFKRFVVLEFPTFESAVNCFESPEYKAAATHRRNGAGIVENVIVDGGEFTK